MVPLLVRVSVPVCDVTVPLVNISALAVVPVTEKLPPTLEVPMIVAEPELDMNEVPGAPVFEVTIDVDTKTGEPEVPMLPVFDVRLSELVVTPGESPVEISPPILVMLTVPP